MNFLQMAPANTPCMISNHLKKYRISEIMENKYCRSVSNPIKLENFNMCTMKEHYIVL